MATAIRYGGFQPFRGDDSVDIVQRPKTAAVIYKGDVVYGDSDGKVLSVTDDAASTHAQAKAIVGIAMEYASATATTVPVALIKKDDLFICQTDGALATTNLNNNADMLVGTGSGKLSGHALDGSSAATTTLLTLKIMGFLDGPDSTAATAYQYVIVRFNLYVGDTTGTTGI